MTNARSLCILAISTATVVATFACAEKRTKYSDKTMRVMIDPQSIDHANYVRLQESLMSSGKWFVVDRRDAWKAVKREQERTHRDEIDRYEDKQKWAMWGKMYGVGGIVVPNAQCQTNYTWVRRRPYEFCLQTLSMVDATTGEVIVVVSNKQEGGVDELQIAPEWNDTVDKLNANYPSRFESKEFADRLKDYMKEAEENAKQQRKPAAQEPTAQPFDPHFKE